jgi:hypothetical protein
MPRRKRAEKREIKPDPKYNDVEDKKIKILSDFGWL